jgi:hypothetical protein
MAKVNTKRRSVIIAQLVELSRNGWANARVSDWKPLEDELARIDGGR